MRQVRIAEASSSGQNREQLVKTYGAASTQCFSATVLSKCSTT